MCFRFQEPAAAACVIQMLRFETVPCRSGCWAAACVLQKLCLDQYTAVTDVRQLCNTEAAFRNSALQIRLLGSCLCIAETVF